MSLKSITKLKLFSYHASDADLELIDEVANLGLSVQLHIHFCDFHVDVRDVTLALLDIPVGLVEFIVHIEQHVCHNGAHLVLNVELPLPIRYSLEFTR